MFRSKPLLRCAQTVVNNQLGNKSKVTGLFKEIASHRRCNSIGTPCQVNIRDRVSEESVIKSEVSVYSDISKHELNKLLYYKIKNNTGKSHGKFKSGSASCSNLSEISRKHDSCLLVNDIISKQTDKKCTNLTDSSNNVQENLKPHKEYNTLSKNIRSLPNIILSDKKFLSNSKICHNLSYTNTHQNSLKTDKFCENLSINNNDIIKKSSNTLSTQNIYDTIKQKFKSETPTEQSFESKKNESDNKVNSSKLLNFNVNDNYKINKDEITYLNYKYTKINNSKYSQKIKANKFFRSIKAIFKHDVHHKNYMKKQIKIRNLKKICINSKKPSAVVNYGKLSKFIRKEICQGKNGIRNRVNINKKNDFSIKDYFSEINIKLSKCKENIKPSKQSDNLPNFWQNNTLITNSGNEFLSKNTNKIFVKYHTRNFTTSNINYSSSAIKALKLCGNLQRESNEKRPSNEKDSPITENDKIMKNESTSCSSGNISLETNMFSANINSGNKTLPGGFKNNINDLNNTKKNKSSENVKNQVSTTKPENKILESIYKRNSNSIYDGHAKIMMEADNCITSFRNKRSVPQTVYGCNKKPSTHLSVKSKTLSIENPSNFSSSISTQKNKEVMTTKTDESKSTKSDKKFQPDHSLRKENGILNNNNNNKVERTEGSTEKNKDNIKQKQDGKDNKTERSTAVAWVPGDINELKVSTSTKTKKTMHENDLNNQKGLDNSTSVLPNMMIRSQSVKSMHSVASHNADNIRNASGTDLLKYKQKESYKITSWLSNENKTKLENDKKFNHTTTIQNELHNNPQVITSSIAKTKSDNAVAWEYKKNYKKDKNIPLTFRGELIINQHIKNDAEANLKSINHKSLHQKSSTRNYKPSLATAWIRQQYIKETNESDFKLPYVKNFTYPKNSVAWGRRSDYNNEIKADSIQNNKNITTQLQTENSTKLPAVQQEDANRSKEIPINIVIDAANRKKELLSETQIKNKTDEINITQTFTNITKESNKNNKGEMMSANSATDSERNHIIETRKKINSKLPLTAVPWVNKVYLENKETSKPETPNENLIISEKEEKISGSKTIESIYSIDDKPIMKNQNTKLSESNYLNTTVAQKETESAIMEDKITSQTRTINVNTEKVRGIELLYENALKKGTSLMPDSTLGDSDISDKEQVEYSTRKLEQSSKINKSSYHSDKLHPLIKTNKKLLTLRNSKDDDFNKSKSTNNEILQFIELYTRYDKKRATVNEINNDKSIINVVSNEAKTFPISNPFQKTESLYKENTDTPSSAIEKECEKIEPQNIIIIPEKKKTALEKKSFESKEKNVNDNNSLKSHDDSDNSLFSELTQMTNQAGIDKNSIARYYKNRLPSLLQLIKGKQDYKIVEELRALLKSKPYNENTVTNNIKFSGKEPPLNNTEVKGEQCYIEKNMEFDKNNKNNIDETLNKPERLNAVKMDCKLNENELNNRNVIQEMISNNQNYSFIPQNQKHKLEVEESYNKAVLDFGNSLVNRKTREIQEITKITHNRLPQQKIVGEATINLSNREENIENKQGESKKYEEKSEKERISSQLADDDDEYYNIVNNKTHSDHMQQLYEYEDKILGYNYITNKQLDYKKENIKSVKEKETTQLDYDFDQVDTKTHAERMADLYEYEENILGIYNHGIGQSPQDCENSIIKSSAVNATLHKSYKPIIVPSGYERKNKSLPQTTRKKHLPIIDISKQIEDTVNKQLKLQEINKDNNINIKKNEKHQTVNNDLAPVADPVETNSFHEHTNKGSLGSSNVSIKGQQQKSMAIKSVEDHEKIKMNDLKHTEINDKICKQRVITSTDDFHDSHKINKKDEINNQVRIPIKSRTPTPDDKTFKSQMVEKENTSSKKYILLSQKSTGTSLEKEHKGSEASQNAMEGNEPQQTKKQSKKSETEGAQKIIHQETPQLESNKDNYSNQVDVKQESKDGDTLNHTILKPEKIKKKKEVGVDIQKDDLMIIQNIISNNSEILENDNFTVCIPKKQLSAESLIVSNEQPLKKFSNINSKTHTIVKTVLNAVAYTVVKNQKAHNLTDTDVMNNKSLSDNISFSVVNCNSDNKSEKELKEKELDDIPVSEHAKKRIHIMTINEIKFPLINIEKSFLPYPTEPAKALNKNYKEKRAYKHIPSVSKILNETLSHSIKDALHKWKYSKEAYLNTTHRIEEYYKEQLLNDIEFHDCIRRHILKTPLNLLMEHANSRLKGSLKSLKDVFPKLSNVTALESPVVHSELPYHGIVDCIACYEGNPVLIEWKQADQPKSLLDLTYDAPIQLSAYIGAVNHDKNYSLPIKSGMIIVAHTDGSPADVFQLTYEECQKYWKVWLERIEKYIDSKIN